MSYRPFRPSVPALAVTLASALAACDDAASVQVTSTVEVLLTDAPPSHFIAQAHVDIGAVELLGGPGGTVVLSEDGTEGALDLMELRGAATTSLAISTVPVGRYEQLRMVVQSASVTLVDGYVFGDNTRTMELAVPSGAQSGLKLNLGGLGETGGDGGGGAFVEPGRLLLVADFDLDRSFVLQGAADAPAGFSGVSFTPTIRLSVADGAGSISGHVTTVVPDVAVGGVIVTATPLTSATLEPYQTDQATAVTGTDGSFSISFLAPGPYTVSVEVDDGLGADPVRATVPRGGAVSDVEIELVES